MKIKSQNKIMREKSQSGFTLIELLVSATLGLFLVGGVITNFVNSKSSDRTRAAISEMDSDARQAMKILRQTISHASYPSTNNNLIDKPFYSKMDRAQVNEACADGISLNASSGGSTYTPGRGQFTRDRNKKGDVLTVVYLADNPCTDGSASCTGTANIDDNALVYTDCVGGGATRDARAVSCSTDKMPDPNEAKIYSTFFLKKERGEYALFCRGNRGGTQPLVENIKNMQFLYGVKDDDGSTRYFSANQVENKNRWENVVSVRVALLVQSAERGIVKSTNGIKNKYILLNKNIEVDDLTRLYRVYTATINIPNKIAGAL